MDYSLEKLTNQQLDFINARFISPDKDMFSIKTVGAGFNTVIAERVINFILENCSSFYSGNTIVIINDLSLHMTKALINAGISPKNIKLTFCKFDNKSKTLINNDSAISKIFKLHPVIRQNKDLEIITFEEVQSMKINGIIANPPYAAIGANITDKIRTTVDYDEYINLLPANDYKRNTGKDLFKYAREMIAINDGFEDAAVTTHLAKVVKEANDMTLDEFEISHYIDPMLNKYFAHNNTKHNYAIDSAMRLSYNAADRNPPETLKTVIISIRYSGNKHLPYGKNTDSYKWNVENTCTLQDLKNNIGKTGSPNAQFSHYFIQFKSPTEKQNFINLFYLNKDGFRFIAKILTAINADSMVPVKYAFPKVDWSRSWTVEEILTDYGYTETEIQEVMNDLNNYKYMED